MFRYLLAHFEHVRWMTTVFVLGHNRELHGILHPTRNTFTLAHCRSMVEKSTCYVNGPAKELCDLLFVPISQAAGLHKVHPTWAGTFVLAALTLMFPSVHLVLLDSDCVPVTFEVADLWKEVSLIRNLAAECPLPAHQNTADSSHSSAESAPKAPMGGKELQHQDCDKESFLSQNTMLKSMQALLLYSALDMRPQ